MPNLTKAYEKYGKRGLEIIGVTLDESQRVPATSVERFVKEQKMRWEQVYKGAQGLAASFGVTGIPAAFLVDGDTGAILARGDELRGNALTKTIEKNLKGGSN